MNSRIEQFIDDNHNLSEVEKVALLISIEETRNEYQKSLTVSDISEITNYEKPTGLIPPDFMDMTQNQIKF